MSNDRTAPQLICKTVHKDEIGTKFYGLVRFFPHALLFLLPLLLFIAFFHPSFSPSTRFSYRDEAFYYYPLFEQIQTEWERGRLPLWNPNENLGQPLAADPTASVFYPGKIIFFLSSLRLCDYALCFKLYIWSHVILAFVLSYKLTRKLSVSQVGAILAATAYTFSGQTLFQYSNPIYLVGAAWTPGMFYYIVDIFKPATITQNIKTIVKLSVVQALTILGGEPQIVYLTLLIGTVTLLLNKTYQRTMAQSSNVCKIFKARLIAPTAFFISTSALTFCLASVQILPSLEAIASSSRSSKENVYSLWEAPKALYKSYAAKANDESANISFSGLVGGDFSENGKSASIYRFSVGPWRWLEYIFPNIGGRQFPRMSRWFEVFPGEISVWTPTLYCGLLPFLIALSSMRFNNRSQNVRNRYQFFFTWLTVLSAIGALGGFGLVWFWRAFNASLHFETPGPFFLDHDPVGGLYWLLNVVIPKFSQFRYPAKLLALTTLGISCLTGLGWDRARNFRYLFVLNTSVMFASITGLVAVYLFGKDFFGGLAFSDPLFGKFQSQLAFEEVVKSLVQTLCVVLTSSVLLFFLYKNFRSHRHRTYYILSLCFLAITAADLFIANQWIIVSSPTSVFDKKSTFLTQIQEENALESKTFSNLEFVARPPIRFYRFPVWFPPLFKERSSERRNAERVIWDVETLFPKYGLNKGLAAIDVRGAISEADYFYYIQSLIQKKDVDQDLGFLGVSYVIGPRFWTERLLGSHQKIENSVLDYGPELRKVHSPAVRGALFQNGRRVDSAFLRSHYQDSGIDMPQAELDNNSVEVLSYEPNKIVYLIKATQESDAIFPEQYWSGWYAQFFSLDPENVEGLKEARYDARTIYSLTTRSNLLEAKRLPVERTYGFLRKIQIPQGTYCVTFEYRPISLVIGTIIALIGWSALAIISAYYFRKWMKKETQKGA